MTQITDSQQQDRVRWPGLALAVYREIAAHLQQVAGVQTELISQSSPDFSYTQSQIDSLLIQYPVPCSPRQSEQVQAILAHYTQRYGQWQQIG